ncbi:MAG TPA: phosphatase PAP2 family protein [Thermomicrobiales bacterium]|jgi:membrane-associated phospholipid phosphatase
MASGAITRRLATVPRRERARALQIVRLAVTVVANIAVFMVLFQAYKLVRKAFIQRAESLGYDHARQVIHLERRLHVFVEPALQGWLLRHQSLIEPFNRYYAAFMWLFYLCCIAGMVLAPVRYRRYRRVFLLSMVIALPWYALYPLAPPRFMPEYGFVDTLAVYGPSYFKDNGFVAANHYAAMPSMHVGWTTIGAFMLAAAIPYKRIGAILGALHVAMMGLTVMVTGNHYLLDIVGGWLVVAAAFGVVRLLPAELRWPWHREMARAGMQNRVSVRQSPQHYEKLRRVGVEHRKQSAKPS